jgi:protein SCO1/2
MSDNSKKFEVLVWGALFLVIIGVVAIFISSKQNSTEKSYPVIGKVGDFQLTNQNNQPVSMTSQLGNVWIGDIIFTRCPGPCAKMTRHMAELQGALPTNQPIKLISFTSDPEYDTPPILQTYAERFGADSNRWSFLTGDKALIHRLATNDIKFVVVEKSTEQKESENDLFIHSTWFVLVDKRGQVRGWKDEQGNLHAYFDSESAEERARILEAAKRLSKESTP